MCGEEQGAGTLSSLLREPWFLLDSSSPFTTSLWFNHVLGGPNTVSLGVRISTWESGGGGYWANLRCGLDHVDLRKQAKHNPDLKSEPGFSQRQSVLCPHFPCFYALRTQSPVCKAPVSSRSDCQRPSDAPAWLVTATPGAGWMSLTFYSKKRRQ